MSHNLPRDFATAFKELTGHDPFPWQSELYRRFTSDNQGERIPPVCRIPTGLGKTNLIAVWLIALRHGAPLPRRLVYVVNRRTVVDQTTEEVERIRNELGRFETPPHLALSTLRGQFADNRQWLADPSRPAVICGTVDMIGSRLLFSGYRIGFKSRPLHAGFLGQDALLVHDEAHLEPAFQKLIEDIQDEQRKEREANGDLPWPGLRVMALSATARCDYDLLESDQNKPFELTDEEKQLHEVIPDPPTEPIHYVWRRLKAKKSLRLHPCGDQQKLAEQIADLAVKHEPEGAAVLIFAQKVDDVVNVVDRLKKKDVAQANIATLTGTMRGFERDVMTGVVQSNDDEMDELGQSRRVFARFMPSSITGDDFTQAKGTVYLVCTSAGEVGVNLSADHMACDLSTFDSMAQRFGRVNRFGDRDDTRIDVVHPASFDEKHSLTPAREATLVLLNQLNGDASPKALDELPADKRAAAFSPEPIILPATDILFDAWALTTITGTMPGRPPVAPYLHGVAEWEPKRTSVAWRDEVELVTDDLIEREGDDFPQQLLADYPLKPHELLTDRSDRIYGALQGLIAEPKHSVKGEKHKAALDRARKNATSRVWLVDMNGSVTVTTFGKLLGDDKKRVINRLEDGTVLLEPSVGGLSTGMLDPKSDDANDVAGKWLNENNQPRRQRFRDDAQVADGPEGMALIRTIDLNSLADEMAAPDDEGDVEAESDADDQATPKRGRYWHWYSIPRDAENPTSPSSEPITWNHHTRDVVHRTTDIVDALKLPDELKRAIILAAELHDLGKQRIIWQRSIGNPNPSDWYAKPGKPADGPRWRSRHLSDYRHEFGSLLDAEREHAAEFKSLDDELRDLVLHLVAAHHGYARPHFPPGAYDHERYDTQQNECAAHEVMRRYARLQRRFGRWGLAYLESLLRAADWAASADPSPAPLMNEVNA